MDLPTDTTTALRIGLFVGFFALFAALEAIWPRRQRSLSRWLRWPTHFGLSVLGSLLLKVLLPIGAAGFSATIATKQLGLLNVVTLPTWVEIAAAVLLLDLAIYAQHIAFHRIGWLWRLHRVHHADTDLDASSGFRFHPGEILLSFGFKLVLILVFGIHWFAVILFEILLNGSAIFNHANFRIAQSADRHLRRLIVTPDMHRVHHSTDGAEQQRNFGFCLSLWDKIFRTYQAQPEAGHKDMEIGLKEVPSLDAARFTSVILMPFRNR